MSDNVVTTLTIDSDTSGYAAYERAMKSAEDVATNYNLAIAGVGAAALAGLAGLKSLMDYVASANKDLADMQKTAKQVGLSLADFQGLQFGGQIAGLSEAQINAGLEKSAQLLNDAQRNANSLSKQFEANGLSIKNANGQLISQNQLLGIAADMIKRAQSPGDQVVIAQMLGFTKEWIPLLQQGSGAMAGLTDEARKAGAVIDDETVQKAADFDREWRKSSVEMSFYMKAALTGLLPYVDDLISRLSKFLKTIDWAKVATHFEEGAGKLGDAAGIPNEAGITIKISPEAKQAIDDISNAATLWEQIVKAGKFLSMTPGEIATVSPVAPEDMKWHNGTKPEKPILGDQGLDTLPAALASMKRTAAWVAEGNAWKNLSTGFLSSADAMAAGFTRIAGKGDDAKDALTRAMEAQERFILVTNAAAAAVGAGVYEQQKAKTIAELTAAAQRAGVTDLEKYAAAWEVLGDRAGKAKLNLDLKNLDSNIKFTSDTMFFTNTEKQIASIMKTIHGDEWQNMMDGPQASAMRFNATMEQTLGMFKEVGKSMLSAFLSGKSVMDAMVSSLDNVAKKLSDQAFEDALMGVAKMDPMMLAKAGLEAGASMRVGSFTGDEKRRANDNEAPPVEEERKAA
jgi:hypothetical protein